MHLLAPTNGIVSNAGILILEGLNLFIMKILRTILYIILALVAIYLLLALIAPKESTVERSTTIDAPLSMVYEHVNSLEDMNTWSPWADKDPNQEEKYTGETGTVGSEYYWSGNDTVGEGTQTITAIEENKMVATKLNFVRPWPGEADANIQLEETDEGTKVTWGFLSETPFPMNVGNLFINMDKMLGPDYETGMSNLKSLVEGKMKSMEIDGYTISVQDLAERHYVGVKDKIGFDAMDGFFQKSMSKVAGVMNKMGLMDNATSSAIYWTWDEETKQTELMSGMYTDKGNGDVLGLDSYKVDSGSAVVIEYAGDYEQSYAVHGAVEKFMKMTGYESTGICMEDYLVGAGVEEDASKWQTRVVYPIK